jgi:hypothetical protein
MTCWTKNGCAATELLVSGGAYKHCTADIGDFVHQHTTDIILFLEKYFEVKHEMGSTKNM